LVQAATVSNNIEPALKEFTGALSEYQGSLVDLIYDKPSALYFTALHRGIKAQDGLPMLIEQARLSQKLWWGKSASYEDLALAIKNTGKLG
jgi:shikimate 5-dehydrogenase